jgi:hypothetical protein
MKSLLLIYCLLFITNNKWFNQVYDKLEQVPLGISIFDIKDNEGNSLTLDQYNDLIGKHPNFVIRNGEMTREALYGQIEESTEAYDTEKVKILGKIPLNENFKFILLSIKLDDAFSPIPRIFLCSISNENKLISGIQLFGAEIASYGGRINNESDIKQIISTESSLTKNVYEITDQGYFKLISHEYTETN